jgi:hypothetical protein
VVDLDRDEEMGRFDTMLNEATEYSAIVAAWNESLGEEPAERSYRDFCKYILDEYAKRYEESGDASA